MSDAFALGQAIPPEIQVTSEGEALLPRAEAVAEALVPTISVVAVVTPPVAIAVTEALAPTITVTGEVSAPTATATAEALAPTITAGAVITLPTATATATALTPTVTVRTFPQRVAANGNVTAAAGTNGATSATFNYPSGSASGDLLVMMVQISRTVAGAYSIPTPTGGGNMDSDHGP